MSKPRLCQSLEGASEQWMLGYRSECRHHWTHTSSQCTTRQTLRTRPARAAFLHACARAHFPAHKHRLGQFPCSVPSQNSSIPLSSCSRLLVIVRIFVSRSERLAPAMPDPSTAPGASTKRGRSDCEKDVPQSEFLFSLRRNDFL